MGESDLRGAGPVWRAISQRVTQGSLVLAALISVVVVRTSEFEELSMAARNRRHTDLFGARSVPWPG